MRPSDIKCRLCGYNYAELDGCRTCRAAKDNIVWPATASEELDLLGLSRKAIGLIELSLDRLEKDMRKWKGKDGEGFYYAPHAKEAATLGRSLAFMLAEARKLEERDEKKVAKMGYAERVELWMDFLDSLPQEHQRNVIRTLGERPWVAGLLESEAEVVE